MLFSSPLESSVYIFRFTPSICNRSTHEEHSPPTRHVWVHHQVGNWALEVWYQVSIPTIHQGLDTDQLPTKCTILNEPIEPEASEPSLDAPPSPNDTWKIYVDGSSNPEGSKAESHVSPEGIIVEHNLHLEFCAINNETEYETLIAGLDIAKELEV